MIRLTGVSVPLAVRRTRRPLKVVLVVLASWVPGAQARPSLKTCPWELEARGRHDSATRHWESVSVLRSSHVGDRSETILGMTPVTYGGLLHRMKLTLHQRC